MRFAFTTQPIESSKDGKETLDLHIRNASSLGGNTPELIMSWHRTAKEDWKIFNLSLACTVDQHEPAARLFRGFSKFLDKKDLDSDDADAIMVEIERAKGFQIVYDPRTKKNVKVDELGADGKGTQYVAKADGIEVGRCFAEDEKDAKTAIIRSVQRLMEQSEDEAVIDACAKWFKQKKKIEKTAVTGNAPKPHPIEAYLKRSAHGHRKMVEKTTKSA